MVAAVLGTDSPQAGFDYELARRLLTTAVTDSSEIQTVRQMLGEDNDDLISAGVVKAREGWAGYNPDKATASTFIQTVGIRGVYDFLRRKGSQQRTEQRSMGLLPKADKSRELCDWLADVFEAAKRAYAEKAYLARRTYPLPVTIALASLMHDQQWSSRECARQLAKREDLRGVLRMKRVPHWTSLARAATLLKKKMGLRGATDMPANDRSDATA